MVLLSPPATLFLAWANNCSDPTVTLPVFCLRGAEGASGTGEQFFFVISRFT
jgi:hypothetical protein